MSAEEPKLEAETVSQDLALARSLDNLLNFSPVDGALWTPNDSLGTIALSELGLYGLDAHKEGRTVADWVPLYTSARETLDSSLSAFIAECVARPDEIGMNLVDILTSEPILSRPILDEEQLSALADKLIRDQWAGFDNLVMLAGLLSKRQLAILLNSLPDTMQLTPASRQEIKMSARKVDNTLIDDSETKYRDTDAVEAFKETLARALESDDVQEYSPDVWGPKIFLLREAVECVAMVRRIDIGNFAAWLRAYEASDVWQELGFNHIPIEPILYFLFDPKHATVDTRTMLLRSRGFGETKQDASPDELRVIEEQRMKIKKGLDSTGVIHGHLHNDNLQVVYTTEGPQVYLIDFDKARIKKDIKR